MTANLHKTQTTTAMFEMNSILVSVTHKISVENASNADYIWLSREKDSPFAVIVVPHNPSEPPRIYRCIGDNSRFLIMKKHHSYPVRIGDVRSFVATKLQHLRALDSNKLRETLIDELELAFPEFKNKHEVAEFVDENWHWLQSLIATGANACQ